MKFAALFIWFLQIKTTLNEKNNCACGINRRSNTKTQNNFFNFLPRTVELNQCPLYPNEQFSGKESYSGVTEVMVFIPSGNYQVGTDDIMIPADEEGPKRFITLKSFYLDKYEVSNRDFTRFVELTKYMTEAESFGDSFVFTAFLNSSFEEQMKDFRVLQAPWWYKIAGAGWRHPYGPDSDITDVMDHPVIHVSWRDAKAYCEWRGGRLPTEAEWEAACRGGRNDTKYPWGDKLFPDRKHMANIWQGTFPNHNSAKDGYIGTSPVEMFPPNDFGMYNMAGNVWEWTEDTWAEKTPQEKVKKGGSYLCHKSYCYRYRCSARSHNTEDSSAGNLGFRCAKSA